VTARPHVPQGVGVRRGLTLLAVLDLQVVVEEVVHVVRSGAVVPLDADAIMFSDPSGELAEDAGLRLALRKLGSQLLLHGEAPLAWLEDNEEFELLASLHVHPYSLLNFDTRNLQEVC
jgi:hypothetical protein